MVDKIIVSNNEQEIMQVNLEMIFDGYFYFVLQMVIKLLEFQLNSFNYNYWKGYVVFEMNGDYVMVFFLLERVVIKVKKNYDMFFILEQVVLVDVYYYLVCCYYFDYQIFKVVEYYNKFFENFSFKLEFVFFFKLKFEQCVVV